MARRMKRADSLPGSPLRVLRDITPHMQTTPAQTCLSTGNHSGWPKSTRLSNSASVRVQRIRRIKAATKDTLTPSARLVLRCLADHAGDSPECWPAVRTLAADCGLSDRQTRRILRELQAAGWFTTRPRYRRDGGQSSTVFVWLDPAPAAPAVAAPAAQAAVENVTPPLTPVSPPYEDSREHKHKKHDVRGDVVCVKSSGEQSQESQATGVAVLPLPADYDPDTTPAPAAQRLAVGAVLQVRPRPATATPSGSARPAPAAQTARRGWLRIDSERLTDGRYAVECHGAAVRAGLLPASEAARLCWLACWCTVVEKFRRCAVRNPAAVLRWLLANPKTLAAYPSQTGEDKARQLLRRLG